MSSSLGLKRFYKTASAEQQGDGYVVLLDGRVVKTPEQEPLLLPTMGLAKAVAAEWDAQGKEIKPSEMPMMTLACTAVDWVGAARPPVEESISAYAAHDLVCYWDASDTELLSKQKEVWQPLLDWTALTFDAPLVTTSGLISIDQPEDALRALHNTVCTFSNMELAVLSAIVRTGGSLVIGLALLHGHLNVEKAQQAVLLHEMFQIERWGADEEAEQRHVNILTEFRTAMKFLTLSRD
ncbi:ATPase [Kiloniella laminariae]|uniref:ATPase n=1 Tax=Kiloniella laminariae TaxID=454162 RepID=A0ABT4LPB8_9PROT|nr:ATP12 family protein [Kiloniella laminariae]MCZ4282982.1 ATPase [Kiloniella laminariae]